MFALYSIRMHLCASEGLEIVKATAWRSLRSSSSIQRGGRIPAPQRVKYLHLRKSPTYPPKLYSSVTSYHQGQPELLPRSGMRAWSRPSLSASIIRQRDSHWSLIWNGNPRLDSKRPLQWYCEKSFAKKLLSSLTTALALLLLYTRPSTGLTSLGSSSRCIFCRIIRNNRTLSSWPYKHSSNQQRPNRFDPRKLRLWQTHKSPLHRC